MLLRSASSGGMAPIWVGFRPLALARMGTSTQAPLRQVVNQAEIPHVAVELKGRVVTEAGIKDIAGKFSAHVPA